MVGWAQRVPGLLLVGVLAVAAVAAATLQGGPLPPYALFFGMVLHHLGRVVNRPVFGTVRRQPCQQQAGAAADF